VSYQASTMAPLFLMVESSLDVAEIRSVLSAWYSKEFNWFDALWITNPGVISEAEGASLGITILNL